MRWRMCTKVQLLCVHHCLLPFCINDKDADGSGHVCALDDYNCSCQLPEFCQCGTMQQHIIV